MRRVADFIGIDDEKSIQRAVDRSAFDWMKANGSKFDEHTNRARRDHVFGAVTSDGSASKVSVGKAGKGADTLGALADEIKEAVQVELKRVHPRDVESYMQLRKDAFTHLPNSTFQPE